MRICIYGRTRSVAASGCSSRNPGPRSPLSCLDRKFEPDIPDDPRNSEADLHFAGDVFQRV
jgi:hypothetical protein